MIRAVLLFLILSLINIGFAYYAFVPRVELPSLVQHELDSDDVIKAFRNIPLTTERLQLEWEVQNAIDRSA